MGCTKLVQEGPMHVGEVASGACFEGLPANECICPSNVKGPFLSCCSVLGPVLFQF
jgi:hypothetical protein